MWLSPALLLLSLPGCFSLQGPRFVRGPERGSLTVHCRYNPGWEAYVKWWCRGAKWDSCDILIRTTKSEQKVMGDRVSLTDNQRDHLITVTMEELRRDDQDTYWCGIQKTGPDLGTSVKVIIDPEGTVVTSLENLMSGTTANRHSMLPFGAHIRTHYILLVFVKVPILLILVGVILWFRVPPRVPKEPTYMNLSFDLNTDTAP